LLDAAGFTRGLEGAYADMWRAYSGWGDPGLRLHVGGQQKRPGWKILNAAPGPDIDYVGDCLELPDFADGSVDDLYAAQLLDDPGTRGALPEALRAFHRVLKPGGVLRLSVPDAEVLGPLLADQSHVPQD